MAFFDNVTWPKVALVLGFFGLLIGARVLFPEAADWLIESTVRLGGVVRDYLGG